MYNENQFVNPSQINDVLKKLVENKEPIKPLTQEQLELIANEKYLYNEDIAYKRACKGRDRVLFNAVSRTKECKEWLVNLPNKFKKYATIVPYLYGGSLLPSEFEDLFGHHERLNQLAKKYKSSNAFHVSNTDKPLILYGSESKVNDFFSAVQTVFSLAEKRKLKFYTSFLSKDAEKQSKDFGMAFINNTDDYVCFDNRFTFREFLLNKIKIHENSKDVNCESGKLRSVILTSNLDGYIQKSPDLCKKFTKFEL